MASYTFAGRSNGKVVSLLNDDNVQYTSPSSSPSPPLEYRQAYPSPHSQHLDIDMASRQDEPARRQRAVSSHPYASPPASVSDEPSPTATNGGDKKKKHICPTCSRPFTTSGHLARHMRVHTGERNHKCPFPACETRCSRQDNLQQQ